MHIADCHLGYWQYNLKDRYNDFALAFFAAIEIAIDQKVDFVLLAGDLFDKRSIDARTLNQAIHGLELLKKANIPCIAVEGNHELAYYQDHLGWMSFLDIHNYLTLLNPRFESGEPQLGRYAKHQGSFVDPLPWLRVHGLKYLGASAAKGLKAYAEALVNLPSNDIEYRIFMTHAGMEGELAEQMGGLSHSDIAPLRDYADYVALGHIHKPYERDAWIYNPGSLETCSISETQWPKRGYYMVEVDTDRTEGSMHFAEINSLPRRPFHRFSHRMDHHHSPSEFYTTLHEELARKSRDMDMQRRRLGEAAVVELQLFGVLPFDAVDLDISRVEGTVRELFHPLHVMVRNLAAPPGFEIGSDGSMSRTTLERNVLEELFSRDVQYSAKRKQWAQAALDIKRLVLDSASSEAILDELAHQMERIEQTPVVDEELDGLEEKVNDPLAQEEMD